jgi:hypothetical protein
MRNAAETYLLMLCYLQRLFLYEISQQYQNSSKTDVSVGKQNHQNLRTVCFTGINQLAMTSHKKTF